MSEQAKKIYIDMAKAELKRVLRLTHNYSTSSRLMKINDVFEMLVSQIGRKEAAAAWKEVYHAATV